MGILPSQQYNSENNLKRALLSKLDHVIKALKIRLNFMIYLANPSNHRSLSPRSYTTISNPINTGIGMETLSGRRRSTVQLTINLTFHSASVATSQQMPCVPLRAACRHTSRNAPPSLVYNRHTRYTLQESKSACTSDYNITNNSCDPVESTPSYEAAKEWH